MRNSCENVRLRTPASSHPSSPPHHHLPPSSPPPPPSHPSFPDSGMTHVPTGLKNISLCYRPLPPSERGVVSEDVLLLSEDMHSMDGVRGWSDYRERIIGLTALLFPTAKRLLRGLTTQEKREKLPGNSEKQRNTAKRVLRRFFLAVSAFQYADHTAGARDAPWGLGGLGGAETLWGCV